MRRQHEDDDKILKDGQWGRVSLMMKDQRDSRVTDASLHRPGYRVTNDAAVRDAKQQARDAYEHELQNAWRIGDKKGTTQRDPQGRLMSTYETEEEEELVRKGMSLDQMQRDHQERMARLYEQRDAEQREMWRKP